jgi:DNA-binding response OmpR family regulator
MAKLLFVVEDEEDINDSVSEVLRDHGFSVISARDGSDAFALLLASTPPPDLVLLDLSMPVVDGATFLAGKAKVPSIADVPVLVLTASRSEVSSPDVIGLIRKPFCVDELIRTIESAPSRGETPAAAEIPA